MLGTSSFQLVNRSFHLDRLRIALVFSVIMAVGIHATMIAVFAGATGRLLVAALVIAFTLIPVFLIFFDILRRAERNAAIFKSLGATRSSILVALFTQLLGIGALSTGLGSFLGLSVLYWAANVGVFPSAGLTLSEHLLLIIQISGAGVLGTAGGAFIGVQRAWKNWY